MNLLATKLDHQVYELSFKAVVGTLFLDNAECDFWGINTHMASYSPTHPSIRWPGAREQDMIFHQLSGTSICEAWYR
jgi:hypothetical protein